MFFDIYTLRNKKIFGLKKRYGEFNATDRGILLNINLETAYTIMRKNSILMQLGLMDYGYDGTVEAPSLSKHLYYQKFHNINEIKEYLLGAPVKAQLNWEDFQHIKQIEILKKIIL